MSSGVTNRPAAAGSSPWIPAARLIALMADPGGTVACTIVLERLAAPWSTEEAGAVTVTNGSLAGASGALDAAVLCSPARIQGDCLRLDLDVTVPTSAPPGRYKAALQVCCGARSEPLALLLEVRPALQGS